MKLSSQAMGAIMMALQKSLLEQSDIVTVIENFDFQLVEDELWVENPPSFKISSPNTSVECDLEANSTVGSD